MKTQKTAGALIAALILTAVLAFALQWEYREATIPWGGDTVQVSIRTNRWTSATERLDRTRGWVPLVTRSSTGNPELDQVVADILAKGH
jgi:hypothetical protein